MKRGDSKDYMGTIGMHQDHPSQTDTCSHPTKGETDELPIRVLLDLYDQKE